MTRRILCTVNFLALFGIVGAVMPAIAQQSATVNRGVVEIETTGTAGSSVRIAEDLANLIDDGATRRVLPIVGKSALQNLYQVSERVTRWGFP